jgi:thiol-disulfide isomerase/thioredoxin
VTTWEGHWAQVVTGRYKSIYNRSENRKTLVKTTNEEFETELRKTEKRITKTNKLGTDFPEFDLPDVNGNRLTWTGLKGKVLVLNFWFIGCSPCEMERPSLNDLTKVYADNEDVVFISFAKNDKAQLTKFLAENPILYNVVPTDKDFIRAKFEINEYPVNIVLDRNGKYFFNSSASGIGILTILQRQIDKALKDR